MPGGSRSDTGPVGSASSSAIAVVWELPRLSSPRPELQREFDRLARAGKLGLTVEFLVLRPEFGRLFSPTERGIARRRLVESGMPGPIYRSSPTRRPMTDWRVKFDGPCARCGTMLLKGTIAVWDRTSRTMHCLDCASGLTTAGPVASGIAGASARREHGRRAAKRSADLRARWGDRVGGWIERLTVEPQSSRAWAIGARGEERLGAELGGVNGIRVLNDRRVPGTRGNIDHIVIAPAGVFVVNAKDWSGTIQIRDVGGLFRTDKRLFVGRREATRLADGLGWQVDAVTKRWPRPRSIRSLGSCRSSASSTATGRSSGHPTSSGQSGSERTINPEVVHLDAGLGRGCYQVDHAHPGDGNAVKVVAWAQ